MISTKNGESEPRTCIDELEQAARKVQDVAYTLANRVDNTTLTELMLASRKLERLSDRIRSVDLGSVEIGGDETS